MFGLTDKVIAIGLGVALAFSLMGNAKLALDLHSVQGDLETRTTERDVATKERDDARGGLATCNAAVGKLKQDSAALHDQVTAALEAASAANAGRRAAAAALQGRVLAGTDTCAGAVANFKKGLKQ